MLEFIPTLTYNNSVSTGNVLLARFEINLCYYISQKKTYFLGKKSQNKRFCMCFRSFLGMSDAERHIFFHADNLSA